MVLTYSVTENGETVTYKYDLNGNLISDSEGNEYAYDEKNRLIYSKVNGIVTEYEIGADGLRKSKTTNGITTDYLVDRNGNVIREDEREDITWGNKPLAKKCYSGQNGFGDVYQDCYYVYNGHGDVVAMVDSKGNIVNEYSYDPWGKITSETETVDNSIKYAGEYYDEETGLIYLRNRYYDPSIGRFISEDPARDELNWYAYCGNNPVMFVDPWGLDWEYYDSYLSEEEQNLISNYTDNYNKASQDDVINISGNIYVNEKEYWHTQAMIIRDRLFDSKYLLYAEKDFEYFEIDENNFKELLGYSDKNATLKQAKYEYALSLYIAYVMSDGGSQERVRNSDGSLNWYGKSLYFVAGKISKLSGKEKANDVPSWARGNKPKEGEDGKSFAKRLMDEKYGSGNWKTTSREYSQIKKWGDRGF